MVKKHSLVLIVVFSLFFAFAANAISAEAKTERELTPRQILILQIPEDHTLDAGDNISWGVVHETLYGPIEYVSKIIRPEGMPEAIFIQITHMLGEKIKGVSIYVAMPFPVAVFVSETNQTTGKMELVYQDSNLAISEENFNKFVTEAREKAVSTMKLLKVFEDEDVATLVKSLKEKEKVGNHKKATSV